MIPVSAAEKILDGKTFFVSTFLDKYNSQLILQGCQFKQVHFKLGFYSKSKKSELNFYSIIA